MTLAEAVKTVANNEEVRKNTLIAPELKRYAVVVVVVSVLLCMCKMYSAGITLGLIFMWSIIYESKVKMDRWRRGEQELYPKPWLAYSIGASGNVYELTIGEWHDEMQKISDMANAYLQRKDIKTEEWAALVAMPMMERHIVDGLLGNDTYSEAFSKYPDKKFTSSIAWEVRPKESDFVNVETVKKKAKECAIAVSRIEATMEIYKAKGK